MSDDDIAALQVLVSRERMVTIVGAGGIGKTRVAMAVAETMASTFDAGVAWSQGDSPELRFDRETADRVPVVSAGVATRLNLFGYAVLEVFWARPFQRPERGGIWGFQLAPGW